MLLQIFYFYVGGLISPLIGGGGLFVACIYLIITPQQCMNALCLCLSFAWHGLFSPSLAAACLAPCFPCPVSSGPWLTMACSSNTWMGSAREQKLP